MLTNGALTHCFAMPVRQGLRPCTPAPPPGPSGPDPAPRGGDHTDR
jgi:hypothetical protein